MTQTQIHNPIIGVDLDDVLWDLLGAWLQRYNTIVDGHVVPADIKSWSIEQYILPNTKEMLFYILEQKDFWKTVQPMSGAAEVLYRLMRDGYNVYIVTASSYKTLPAKLNHFFELFSFVRQDQVVVAKEKQLLDLDVMIDDNPENLCHASYNKLLFDRPSNQWVKKDDIRRVYTWAEIYQFVKDNYPIKTTY